MPPKGAADPKKKVHPPFYAFGKLDKKGQISDKKGAAALAKATVRAGGVLGRLIPARSARVQYASDLQDRWAKGALDVQRVWRGHTKRGIARWAGGTLDNRRVVLRETPGHVKRAGDLQRVWRGHVHRKRVAFGDTPKWHAAASKLQRLYRGSVTRQLTKQLKYVRSVPAAFMIAAMAANGDSGVLRRSGAGKCRASPPQVPTKPAGAPPARSRPDASRPHTQATVSSAAKPPAGPVSAEDARAGPDEIPGQRMEGEVERAMQLSQLFLALTREQLDLVFNCMDATSQGRIRRQEVEKAAQSAQLSGFCVDMFFSLADTNGDGVVDRTEFDEAISFAKLFFSGSLLDEVEADETTATRIAFLEDAIRKDNAEVDQLIESLSKVKSSQRVAAIFALSKRDRIRIARKDRDVIQDATVYMDRKEERRLRQELSAMGDEPDEVREMQAKIAQMVEDMTYSQYFATRSPCRPRQLSRAESAALEAEKRAAEEAAWQAQLQMPALLQVTVLRARNLPAADRSLTGASSDPYVTLQFGKQVRQTNVQKKTLQPHWDETFEVLIDKSERREKLGVKCFDFDLIGQDDLLGQLQISLEPLVPDQENTQWYPFKDARGLDGMGQVQLRFKLVLQTEEEAAESARIAALNEMPAILEITVLRAEDLIAADRGGTSDPYVRIQVGNAKNAAKKTSVKKKTLQPEWNEDFKLQLDASQRRETLTLECFDYDLVGADDSLGAVKIVLETLVHGQEYMQWHSLQQKGADVSKGRLELRYRLSLRNTAQAPATLHVSVVRATGLIAADRGGTSDPYVRLHIGDAVKDSMKTKVKKKTLNPEWNQDFKFRIDGSQRQDDLMIECFDYDRIGADDSLGKASVCIDALNSNHEYVESLTLRQKNSSIGQIDLRYMLREKTQAEAEAEAEMLRPGTLKMTVKGARDLIAADRGGTSDPYVRLHIGDAVKDAQKTKVLKKTLTPVWEETFEFDLDRAQRQDYMTVECFDYDLLGSDDSLGTLDISLDSLIFDQECVEWYQLKQEGESQHQGEVQISYVFVPSPKENVHARRDAATEDEIPLGPANLEFTVLRAKDLVAADRGGTSDPYVRLHVGGAVKQAQKTAVKKKTLSPEWNEAFEFKLDSSSRRDSLTLECFDYDLLGSDDSLGKVTIPLAQLAEDQEYTQWCSLGQDATNQGQVQVRYRVLPLPKFESSVSMPLPDPPSREASVSLNTSVSFPIDSLPSRDDAQAKQDAEDQRRLQDAREKIVLHSCSLFRIVRHSLMLPSDKDKERALERSRAIQLAQSKAMLEIRVALREGDEKFANSRTLLGRGHFQDAVEQLRLAQLCYEYADSIEREANVFFNMQSNVVLFDEGTEEVVAKLMQLEQLDKDIDTTFKDSMRGVWPLHKAAAQGAIGTLAYLIQSLGERVDAVDRAGKTALHVAVETGRLDVVRALIEDFGADASRRTFTGRTPMHIASDKGDGDIVRALFEGCAALITKDVSRGLRPRLSQEQISAEALTVLGTWVDTDHSNSALSLAAHKLHVDALQVYALIQGAQIPQTKPETGNRSFQGDGNSLDLARSDSVSIHSAASKDEEQVAEENAELLRALKMGDEFNSQNMGPFPPCLHWTHVSDLERDLMLEFERKDEERGIRTALRSRPVSASSGSSSSRPSTADSKTSQSQNLAMLRGEFHVCLNVIEARDLRIRPRNLAPSACVDLSWLPAGHGEEPQEVRERTRILRGTTTPSWNAVYDFDVDPDGPDGWSMLTLVVWDVHKQTGFEDFLGTVTLDMSDLCFGTTEGWYDLQDNVDLRGAEVSARNRLRLGQIRPMRPIQGAVYLEIQATNPVSHLPKPPPEDPMAIYADEVMARVMEENRGASTRRRLMIIKDMWQRLIADDPRAAGPYQEQLQAMQESHVERMNQQLLTSSLEGDVIGIRYCIKQGADPNIRNPKNNAAILLAAHHGHCSAVDALIKYKADVHASNDDGATPLYQAASNGHADVVRCLAEANANVEARTNNHATPLVTAAQNGKAAAVEALLDLRADANSRNAMGATALHLSVFGSHAECVRILLDKGANVSLSIKKGALAGTVPHELAKTPEIRELLDKHSSQSAFGLLSLTSISFSSTNASTHPPQHSAPAQDLQLPTPSAEAS